MSNNWYTLRVKSNVHNDLFFNCDAILSFDENEKVAFDETLKNKLPSLKAIANFIEIKFGANQNLEVELIFEVANIEEYPIKISNNMYARTYTKEQQLRDWEIELKDLTDKIAEINSDIDDLQYELECTQDRIEKINDNIEQLEMKEGK